MAKHEGIQANTISDLRWLLAIKHSINKGEMPTLPFPAVESMAKNWSLTDLFKYASTTRDNFRQISNPHNLRHLIGMMNIKNKDLLMVIVLKNPKTVWSLLHSDRETLVQILIDKLRKQNTDYKVPPYIIDIAYLKDYKNIIEILGKKYDENYNALYLAMISYDLDKKFRWVVKPEMFIKSIQYLLKNKLIAKKWLSLRYINSYDTYILLLFYGYNLLNRKNLELLIRKFNKERMYSFSSSVRNILKLQICDMYRKNLKFDIKKEILTIAKDNAF